MHVNSRNGLPARAKHQVLWSSVGRKRHFVSPADPGRHDRIMAAAD